MIKVGTLGNKVYILRLLLICTIVFSLTLLDGTERASEMLNIDGYVYDSCGGCFSDSIPCKPCTVVLDLEKYLYSELDRFELSEEYRVEVHNVLYHKQKQLLSQEFSDKQIRDLSYPVLFINDTILYGWEQIKDKFAQTIAKYSHIEVTEMDSRKADKEIKLIRGESNTIVYFEITSCGACKETKKLLDRISGSYEDLEVFIYNIDDSKNLDLFKTYCTKYAMDANSISVPMILIGDRYLEGLDEIQLFLESYLEAGYGSYTYRVK